MSWRGAAARDDLGRPVGVLLFGTDVTELRANEERTEEMQMLERRRLEVDRLAAIGQLVAGVSHGINNPLAAVKNALRIVADAVPPDHPDRSYVPLIQAEIGRITELVQLLYKLRPPERSTERRASVHSAIDDVVRLSARAAADRGVTVVASHLEEDAWVSAADAELRQALLSVVTNGVAASPPGGTVRIRAEVQGSTATFTVSDEGPGIPGDVLPRVFEPFFTTDATGEHVGLGLSIALGLVRALEGDIGVASELGVGTTFTVVLPLAPSLA
jgi:signal transduction histidine kinase